MSFIWAVLTGPHIVHAIQYIVQCVQVESKALQRLVMKRLANLRSLYIDKDGSSEVPEDVKWTQKSQDVIAELELVFSTECAQLDFCAFSGPGTFT